jgi:hypothetical protein
MDDGGKIGASAKESASTVQKKVLTATASGPAAGSSPPAGRQLVAVQVVTRQQTGDEQRRFIAATDALLAELVRWQLGRGR